MQKNTFLLYVFLLASTSFLPVLIKAQSYKDSINLAFKDYLIYTRDDSLNHQIRAFFSTAETKSNLDSAACKKIVKYIISNILFYKNQKVPGMFIEKHFLIFQRVFLLMPALEIREDIEDKWMLAFLKKYEGKPGEAIAMAKNNFERVKKLNDCSVIEYATGLFLISRFAYNDIPEGIMYSQSAADTLEKAGLQNIYIYTISLRALGSCWQTLKEYKKAASYHLLFIEAVKKNFGKASNEYIQAILYLSSVSASLPDETDIFLLLTEALAISEQIAGKKSHLYATCLDEMQGVYYFKGDYLKALPIAREALAIKEEIYGDDFFDNVLSLHNLATIYDKLGLYDKAMPVFQQSLSLTKKMYGNTSLIVLFDLPYSAHIHHVRGEYDKEINLYQEGFDITKITGDLDSSFYLIPLLYNRAELYAALGLHKNALYDLDYALKVEEKLNGNTHIRYARVLMLLAVQYGKMMQYQYAENAAIKAMHVYRLNVAETSPEYARCHLILSDIYSNRQSYDSALLFARIALNINQQMLGNNHTEVIASEKNLANIFLKNGLKDSAQYYYISAADLSLKVYGEKHPEYAAALFALGKFYADINEYHLAGNLLARSNSIMLSYLQSVMPAISESEKFSVLSKESYQFSLLPSLIYQKKITDTAINEQVYDNVLLLKGLVSQNMANMFRVVRSGADSTDTKLFENWQLYKAFLNQQYLLPVAERVKNLENIEHEADAIEKRLSVKFSLFGQQYQTAPLKSAQVLQQIEKGEAAIEFMRFKLYSKEQTDSIIYAALLLLPGEKSIHFIFLFDEKHLTALISKHQYSKAGINELYSIHYPGSKTLSASKTIYSMIWQPLEKYLKNIHTIYYSPDGFLHRISFDALSDGNVLLAEKYKLHRLISSRTLISSKDHYIKPLSISIWGNINYNHTNVYAASKVNRMTFSLLQTRGCLYNFYTDDTLGSYHAVWNSLPGTKEEVEKINALFLVNNVSTTVISDTAATEQYFKKMDAKSPQILHIATHGFNMSYHPFKDSVSPFYGYKAFAMQQNSMFRSGLILAGGNKSWLRDSASLQAEDDIITADEIARLNLSATELVVLSACETALGDIQGDEGVIGLQRAFKMAGVKQMILSLWPVPDKETTELMEIFYKNLLAGLSPQQALLNTQIVMKKKYSPYYWAAFVLVQ